MGFPIVGAASAALGLLSGGPDPKKQAARFAAIAAAKAAALAGDAKSEVQLACMAGENSPEAIAYGFANVGETCGLATEDTRAAARVALAEVRARKAGGKVLAQIGVIGLGAAEQVAPGSGVTAIAGAAVQRFATGTTFGLPTPLVAFAAAVAVFFGARALMKRGR